MFKTIVVPVDGSDHATKALDLAVDLADKYGAQLLILSVYRLLRVPESSHSMIRPKVDQERMEADLRGLAREIVEAATERVRERGKGEVRAEGVIRQGQPARTIVAFAKERGADAIVMGSRGLGDVGGFLLGSVSHKVSSLAECTCIMVK